MDHFATESADAFLSVSKRNEVRYISEVLARGPAEIDLVFLGTSDSKQSFDAPTLEEYWKNQNHSQPAIYNFSSSAVNPIFQLSLIDTLLHQKKVKMLAVELSDLNGTRFRYAHQFQWWKSPSLTAALAQAPFEDQLRYYAESVMGFPWRLWAYLRPIVPAQAISFNRPYYDLVQKNRGTLADIETIEDPQSVTPFISIDPPARAWQDYIYFNNAPNLPPYLRAQFQTTPMQKLFLLRLLEVCKKQGTRLVLTLPTRLAELNQPLDFPSDLPPELADTPILILPDSWLFNPNNQALRRSTLSVDNYRNKSGRILYTKALAPTLYQLENGGISETH